jgi:ubiquitin C-terminal hydrolase
MFGLRNTRGSCWVNATLQSIFRIPDVQSRYSTEHPEQYLSSIERTLEEIWVTRGEKGLREFHNQIKTKQLPAGEDIGDSHELLDAMCDKVSFLDKLFRFKIANVIKCNHCNYSETKIETLTEFSIAPTQPKMTVSQCIAESVTPNTIDDWVCEKCSKLGCTKQLLLSTFPQVLTFHVTSLDTSVGYSPMLSINKIRYALFAVVCFNGGHWWTYGRDMPPGKPWVEFDDTNVQEHDPTHFPLSDNMRLLMYYRLKE